MIERFTVPTVSRNLGDRVHAVPLQFPEGLRAIGASGKPATDTDNGDVESVTRIGNFWFTIHLIRSFNSNTSTRDSSPLFAPWRAADSSEKRVGRRLPGSNTRP